MGITNGETNQAGLGGHFKDLTFVVNENDTCWETMSVFPAEEGT